MRFGDGSHVEIHGIGSIMMEGRHKQHKVLANVYYILALKRNIVSLDQLEERGFKVVLENGRMCVFDQERAMLIPTPRLLIGYTIKFGLASPICLLTKTEYVAWCWHARFSLLNFRAL